MALSTSQKKRSKQCDKKLKNIAVDCLIKLIEENPNRQYHGDINRELMNICLDYLIKLIEENPNPQYHGDINKNLTNVCLDYLIKLHEENPNKQYGDIKRIIEEHQKDFPFVTRDRFNNRRRALKAMKKAAEAAPTKNSPDESAAKAASSITNSADSAAVETQSTDEINTPGKAGRKKGSTEVVTKMMRQTQNKRDADQVAPALPALERTIVELLVANKRLGTPLPAQSFIIDLANDMIKGMPVEKDIMIDWQIRHNPTIRARFQETGERPLAANLGSGWYKDFRDRNPDLNESPSKVFAEGHPYLDALLLKYEEL
eukprot:CAMPEP_0113611600 /NCGR_PEP_ID=MMETSP0017_2-20120614/5641_1 /TAXON_ID=2856 /ORGANISM="Cylindrotheca closterium" /LENGTH=315 /DNA_ID=CAMNT_0000520555 /DNA_START=235 /DNA_END=1179 /DNA_ORIENTATION=- /assembly_acc=CAM_ASM_000147